MHHYCKCYSGVPDLLIMMCPRTSAWLHPLPWNQLRHRPRWLCWQPIVWNYWHFGWATLTCDSWNQMQVPFSLRWTILEEARYWYGIFDFDPSCAIAPLTTILQSNPRKACGASPLYLSLKLSGEWCPCGNYCKFNIKFYLFLTHIQFLTCRTSFPSWQAWGYSLW